MLAALRRLTAKFDPVERDLRNRALDRAGAEFVLELERRQLAPDLHTGRASGWRAAVAA
jgi:hypothetical protein